MAIQIIVAMTYGRVIGKGGKLPWKIPEDMKLFKTLTEGNTVIMGKNTWLSIPEKFRPLPNRTNIVVSTTLTEARGAIISKTIGEAIAEGKKVGKEVFCIGGAAMYKEFLPLAEVLNISWVKENYSGDTCFPNFNESEWRITEEKDFEKFTYKKYILKK